MLTPSVDEKCCICDKPAEFIFTVVLRYVDNPASLLLLPVCASCKASYRKPMKLLRAYVLRRMLEGDWRSSDTDE